MGAIVNLKFLNKNPKPSGRGGNGDGKIGARMGYIITGEMSVGKWNQKREGWRRESNLVLGGEKDEADAGQKREREASRRRRQKRIIWRWISMERRRGGKCPSEASLLHFLQALGKRRLLSKASGLKDCVSQKDMSVLTKILLLRACFAPLSVAVNTG